MFFVNVLNFDKGKSLRRETVKRRLCFFGNFAHYLIRVIPQRESPA